MTIIIQAVEAGGRSGGETFQLLNLLARNLPIWHFQMLTGMVIIVEEEFVSYADNLISKKQKKL